MTCPAALLAHREDAVITAFVRRWDIEPAEAAALFEDVMAWLWATTRPGAPPLAIDPPLRIVDEMWHELVLHTARYGALCERWFGRFVHHRPDAAGDPAAAITADDAAAQWRFLGTELGVDRLLRWYVDLPLRHDDAWFRRARRVHDTGYRPTPAMIELRRSRGAPVGG